MTAAGEPQPYYQSVIALVDAEQFDVAVMHPERRTNAVQRSLDAVEEWFGMQIVQDEQRRNQIIARESSYGFGVHQIDNAS